MDHTFRSIRSPLEHHLYTASRRFKDEQRFHESFKEEGFMQKAWRVPQRAKRKTVHNQKMCSHASLLARLATIILIINKYHCLTFFFAHIMDQLTRVLQAMYFPYNAFNLLVVCGEYYGNMLYIDHIGLK
ncbi:unnamed protein product [Sphenostylis stenocarpa]|uniref:Uncharacterized protein n=1 Tax=Sphenostylis stenocarpa TaxID=92480 RepID=A0AA86RN89_9FABA|nr:unnamed protein product [Sphenostylis stenocarpa]